MNWINVRRLVAGVVLLPVVLVAPLHCQAQSDFVIDRHEVIPQVDHQVSMRVDGVERLRWHSGAQYPRPFFFPFNGPSGVSLTRMGHPGAQNHDHHRSVWFAHNSVEGLDFWADGKGTQIRQKLWYAYRDGQDEALMALVNGWYGPDGAEIMEQDVVAALRALPDGEHLLELQLTFRPAAKRSQVELGQTNFGFLAVRMARTLSVHFGGGKLSNSEGLEGEKQIFGTAARWMDYSGPVVVGTGSERAAVIEGLTYHDHPTNPRYPTRWHVREDGWMGASFCFQEGLTLTAEHPLTLRYMLHAHRGGYDAEIAERQHRDFAKRPGFQIIKSRRPHRQYDVERLNGEAAR